MDECAVMTATGRWVNPLALRPEDVSIADIAHALSQQCRFSGHTRVFYSVAEHSARMAAQMAYDGHSREACFWALLHDAPEAYLVDLPRPLKRDPELGDAFRRVEERVMHAIVQALDLTPFEPESIKHYDMVMLATEWRDLMPPEGVLDVAVAPLASVIVPMDSLEARAQFISLYFGFRPESVFVA